MTYIETFIQIAPDSEAIAGVVPESNRTPKPSHIIQYELLLQKPYYYNHDDLAFAVHVIRQGLSDEELEEHGEQIRGEFFQKGHPCLRASALTKKYGWGAHYDHDGKIALYAVSSEEYKRFVDTCPNQLRAFRSKRG